MRILHQGSHDAPCGRGLTFLLIPNCSFCPLPPMVLLSFSKPNYLVQTPLLYHTVSFLKAGTEFYSSLYPPKLSSRASYICGKKEWVMAALGPPPMPLLALPEGGQIKPHSKERTACPMHLGGLREPRVQGSSYLNTAGIYRKRSSTPGWTDTEVKRDVSQAVGR